jgi:DNA-binding LacI/PurR family transcriptional regulator
MAKFKNIANLLENRIRHGDYLLKEVPSERELALEVKVSHMTARKAILYLVEKGLLVRQANKRLAVRPKGAGQKKQLQIALLVPAFPSPYIEQWHRWLEEMSSELNYQVRVVGYTHWDESVILDTLEGFGGTFMLPLCDEIPESLITSMKQIGHPLVMLAQDLSNQGIPSLRMTSPQMVQKLLDYLGSLGHRRIDCLNTQPVEQVVRDRIEQWQLWMAAHGEKGRLHNIPVKSFGSAMRQAYETVKGLLTSKEYLSPAIFCTVSGAAIGAIRALYEHGLQVGKDVSVCSAEDWADTAPFLTPALTCLMDRDPKSYLSVCIEWMVRGGKDWVGPLLVQPGEGLVFQGETAGPCPKSQRS